MDTPVKIMELIPEGEMSKLLLNKDCLKKVLDRAGDRKLAFLSVVGPVGTGKSLLMSIVVRYLKAVEKGIDVENPDWLFPEDNPPLEGFPFENSIDAVTSSIQIWPEPFFVGEDTALFVIDTPGLYSSETSFREWGGIVGSTALLSSCMIFNVTKNLEEDNLTALNTFLELAKFLSTDLNRQDDLKVKIFQKIVFLIRDWNNPSDFKYGCGQEFLNKKLATDSQRLTREAAKVRESLKSNVEDLHCFLLPRPDNSNIAFGTHLSRPALGEPFTTGLGKFMAAFINPSQIYPKTFEGLPLTVTTFLEMLEESLKNFNQNLTPVSNLNYVSTQMHMELSVLRSVEYYKSTMARKLSKKSIPRPSHVEKFHADLKPYVVETFKTTNKCQTENVEAYLPNLLKQLDSSHEQFRQEVLVNLQNYMSEVETEAVETVRSQMAQLLFTEVGSNSTFEQLFTRVKSSAKQTAIQKLKSLDTELRKSWEQRIDKLFSSLLEEVQKDRESKVAAILLENKPIVEEALSIYTDRIELTLDTDEGYVSPNKLDKCHKSAVAVAQKFLLSNMTIPETALEIRERLVNKLDHSCMQEYSHLTETNEQALFSVRKSLEDIENNLIVRTESDISEILSKNDNPVSSIQEFKKLRDNVVRKIRCESSKLSISNNGTFGSFENELTRKLHHLVDNAIFEEETRNILQTRNELEAIDGSYQNFLKKSLDISLQILDPEELDQSLQEEKDSELNLCKEKLENLHSKKLLELLQTLSQKMFEESQKLMDTNNQRIQKLESEFDDIANCTISDLSATLENSTNDITSSGRESLKLQYLASMNTQTSHISLPQQFLRKLNAKVEHRIDAVLENYFERFAKVEQIMVKFDANSFVSDATKMFIASMQDYCNNYSILNECQYNNECEKLRADLLEVKAAHGWSPETVQEVRNVIDEELSRQIEKFWTKTVLQKNLKAEYEIRVKMSALKMEFKEKFPASNDKEGLRNKMVSTFKNSLKCSSTVDEDKFCKLLNQNLGDVLHEVEAEFEKAHEVELASEKLIQEFKDSAPDLEDLQELWKEKIKKFEEVAENHAQTQKFKTDIEAVMQNILKARRENVKNIKKMNEVTENLVKDFTNTLKRKGSSNISSLKMDFAEKLLSEAKICTIEPAEFLSRLNKAMETAYNDFEKHMKEQVEAVVGEIVDAYRDEMSSHFSSTVYFTPTEIADLHAEATQEAFSKCPKIKSDEVQTRLKKELDKAYEEFNAKNAMNTPTSFAVGIDLGTTYSCVGVYSNGNVKIIPNDVGKKTTPSYIFFEESGDVVVGEAAKNQAHMYPERTVYEVKRLIGRSIDDPAIQGDFQKWSYKVVEERGALKVQIGESQTYLPEEVSAEILKKLKKCAEDYLGQDVASAVITVPAYFTEGQKAATKRAGEAAGLHVLRILTEPTAAAIAYNLNWKGGQGSSKGLVYDLGGGTFDVAIFTATRGSIDIVSVGGDTHLGGVDFDNEMVEHCIEEFRKQTGIDLMADRDSRDWRRKKLLNRKIMRLKRKCEQYKIDLTQAEFINVAIDNIHEGEDLMVKITRAQFDEMIEKHIQNSLNTVQEVLHKANMSKDDIDEIVLIGGSTRIPKVHRRLMDYFGKALNKNINPDEAVAVGAAYEAAVLNGKRAQEIGDIRSAAVAPRGMSIKDITPMSYGIEVQDGDMCVLIPKQSKVPTEMAQNFTTHYHQQTSVLIVIYEGDDQKVVSNTKVGEFFLNGIPPGLAGNQQVRVTMKVDWNGMITVSAVCLENGVQKNLTVRANRRGMSK